MSIEITNGALLLVRSGSQALLARVISAIDDDHIHLYYLEGYINNDIHRIIPQYTPLSNILAVINEDDQMDRMHTDVLNDLNFERRLLSFERYRDSIRSAAASPIIRLEQINQNLDIIDNSIIPSRQQRDGGRRKRSKNMRLKRKRSKKY